MAIINIIEMELARAAGIGSGRPYDVGTRKRERKSERQAGKGQAGKEQASLTLFDFFNSTFHSSVAEKKHKCTRTYTSLLALYAL